MTGIDDKPQQSAEAAPDPVRYYRPVAIRSVLAAHAMIPRVDIQSSPDPSPAMTALLPAGFHTIAED